MKYAIVTDDNAVGPLDNLADANAYAKSLGLGKESVREIFPASFGPKCSFDNGMKRCSDTAKYMVAYLNENGDDWYWDSYCDAHRGSYEKEMDMIRAIIPRPRMIA